MTKKLYNGCMVKTGLLIRKAEVKDIEGIMELLRQVLEVHAKAYPKIFKSNTTKYSARELEVLINDDRLEIFVAIDSDKVVGHAFVMGQIQEETDNMYPDKILYIDDICVDTNERGKHVGSALFEHVKQYAKANGYNRITLNVWEKNEAAKAFYEAMGMEKLKTMMQLYI